jgi:hypothetical protein
MHAVRAATELQSSCHAARPGKQARRRPAAHGPAWARAGSYGKVYKARWQGALVAIKVIEHAAETERNLALRESELATAIQHPNVVRPALPYPDVQG